MEVTREPKSWGGKREGAGRPKSSPMVSHLTRPRIEKRRCPLKVKIVLRADLPSLQHPEIFEAFERGCHRARRFGIRIIHYLVLPKHIHMIIEAKKTEELEHSFKSLNTTLAIAIKKVVKKESGQAHEGPVFLGRYHLSVLHEPNEVKVAMKEILGLAADNFNPAQPGLSSAVIFDSWTQLFGKHFVHSKIKSSSTQSESRKKSLQITALPQFWLSQAGWLEAKV